MARQRLVARASAGYRRTPSQYGREDDGGRGENRPSMAAEPLTPILLYHKLGRPPRGARVPGHYVSPARFRRHLDYLIARGFTAIPLLDLVDAAQPLPPRPVVITFDDGYRCLREHALPALAERGLPATVFMVAGHVGGMNVWEQAVGDVAEPMLSLAEMREMQAAGIEFGSHTLNHVRLSAAGEEEARRELVESRARLEELLGRPCRSLAYPYGDWSPRVRELAEAAGYQAACTTVRATARRGDDPLALPRINVRRYNPTLRLAWKLWRARRART